VRWLAAEIGKLMANPATPGLVEDFAGAAFAIHAGWFSAYIKTGIWAVIVKNSGVELE
jgi:hypothetical protein